MSYYEIVTTRGDKHFLEGQNKMENKQIQKRTAEEVDKPLQLEGGMKNENNKSI
jgi:hypothetical protein